jgi:hypothetical protein
VQLDENLRTPYAQNWYIGLQQTVTPNFLIEIGNAGSLGRRLVSRDDINRKAPGSPRANDKIGSDTYLSNADNSSYVALEVRLRRRVSRGLQYQVSYTYSHAIDYQSDLFEGVVTGLGPRDFAVTTFTREFEPRLDRGNANFDQRHNLVLSATWNLLPPRVGARWANRLLQGWGVSVIGAYRSGFPVTAIGFTSDPSTTLENNRVDFSGAPGQPFNLPHPTPILDTGTRNVKGVQWLDPSQFAGPMDHVGNVGRGAIKGPGFWNYDFALLRNIALTDRGLRMQLRAEFYNLLNHANLSPPISLLSDSRFGQAFYGVNEPFSRFGDLSLASPSRRIQLGLRIEF